MSKKILKRSLALGALMAFVITGSVWARDISNDQDDVVVVNGIGLYNNIGNSNANASTDTNWILGEKTLWINEACGHSGGEPWKNFAVVNENYKFNGSDQSTLKIGGANDTKLIDGLAIGGTVEVGNLNINVLRWGVYSFLPTNISANNIVIDSTYGYALHAAEGGSITMTPKVDLKIISGSDAVFVDGVSRIEIRSADGYKADIAVDGDICSYGGTIDLKLETKDSFLTGASVLNDAAAKVNLTLDYGATWNVTDASKVSKLDANDGKIVFTNDNAKVYVDSGTASLKLTMEGKTSDQLNTAEQLTTVAEKISVKQAIKDDVKATVVMPEGAVKGEATGDVVFKTVDGEYLGGVVETASVTEKINTTNASVSDIYAIGLMAWRAENNDMNKRLGELRDANGEHGAWVRMTRGESEYESVKNQYNAYQMGYDQKAGDWTVGAAVTYTEAETGFANGSGENDHTGFAVYGSKLNNDGSYIDLIAKYAKLDHEYTTNKGIGSGDYDTDGYALSAEYGKRFAQSKGLWIEPQVELTYGKVDNVDFVAENGNVSLDDMNSLVGRVGFRAGKDIKDGNVYVRASYLYDFDGETKATFTDGKDTRYFEHDLGGGWWEVGIGANINLSKATYIYADVEKTFGGEVDTNWQWNLGVRYSF